jgi:hypothetical protein
VTDPDALAARLTALTALLTARRPLWEERPFATLPPSWAAAHPDVAAFLDGLDHADVSRLEEAEELDPAEVPPAFAQWSREARALTRVPTTHAPALELADKRLAMYVPGRKWAQIHGFAGAARVALGPGVDRIVDWCAGKGHLGRLLGAATGLPVTLVELDPRLADDALDLAAKAGCDVTFHAADALTAAAWAELAPGRAVVALHACGGLTNAAIEQAVRRDVPELVLAPCCYHKAHGAHRGLAPMSVAGARSGFALTHSALRLATADEVVAPGRHRRARRRENAWRLGLDLLLREATGEDVYTPLGTLPREALHLPFEAFCRATAARLGLPLPARFDPAAAEHAGWERARRARGWGLVRSLYRRPLELWLVLDRALYLAEAGRSVSVEAFCERTVTPRNLLIRSSAAR